MSELNELYKEVIIDHGRRPRNFKKLANYTHCLEGFNPLCGDRLTVYVDIADEQIRDISFEGAGCAISMASASLMTEVLKHKTITDADAFFTSFRDLIMDDSTTLESVQDLLGKLTVLAGVKAYPMRVKCATLAWHALNGAIHNEQTAVTTE